MKYMFLYFDHSIPKSIDFNSSNEHFIFVFISKFFPFIWFRSSSELEKQSRPYCCWASPSFLPILYGVSIDRSIYQVHQMSMIGSAGTLELLIILVLGALKALCLGLLWLCSTLFALLLVVTVPIFFYIFANGAVQSPSALFCFWWCCCTRGWLFLGLYFYGWFWNSSSSSIISGRDWQILPQLEEVPWHLLCFGPLGASVNWDVFSGGGLLSEVPSCEGFWPSEFVGALGAVRGGCVVALLEPGLATTFTLYFFVGMIPFLFSVAFVSFLT